MHNPHSDEGAGQEGTGPRRDGGFVFSGFGESPLRSEQEPSTPASSGSTPLWIGSTFSASRNLGDNDATLVLSILDNVGSGQRIDIPSPYSGEQGLDEQLAESGLVELMPDSELRMHRRNLQRLEAIAASITEEEETERSNNESATELRDKLADGWRSFGLTISLRGGRLTKEQECLKDHEEKASAARTRITELEEERADLAPATRDVSQYARVSTGNHLRLTDAGSELLAEHSGKWEELAGVTFADLSTAAGTTVAQPVTSLTTISIDASDPSQNLALAPNNSLELHRRVEQFVRAFTALDDAFSDADPEDEAYIKNLALAASLNLEEGRGPVDIARNAATCLDDVELLYREGFNAAAELVFRGPGATQEYTELLHSMFDAGHRESVTTAVEATAVMDVPGTDIYEKQELQNRYRRALRDEGDWMYGAHATCYIAAKLAAKEGSSEEAIDRAATMHRELELACIDTGRSESVQLGYAALILMDAEAEPRQIARRFSAAFQALKDVGFENKTRLYPTAAFMALRSDDLPSQAEQIASIKQSLQLEHGLDDRFGGISLSLLTGENNVLPVIDKGSPSASRRTKAGKESLL